MLLLLSTNQTGRYFEWPLTSDDDLKSPELSGPTTKARFLLAFFLLKIKLCDLISLGVNLILFSGFLFSPEVAGAVVEEPKSPEL